MKRSFEYLHVVKAMDSIDVDDVGNVCMTVFNDFGAQWYLIIKTECGMTRTEIFGPFMVDINDIYKGQFSYSCFTKSYSEKSIVSTIEKFLTNPIYAVSQAFIIDYEEAEQRLKDLFQNKYIDNSCNIDELYL